MKERTRMFIDRYFLPLLVIGAILETAWTIYIGVILPRQYSANHWDFAWVGLDIAQLSMLIGAAWAAWRRSIVLVLFATACATLLVVDAWFDVTTTRRGNITQSLLQAIFVELPSALVMLWVALRSLHQLPMPPVPEESRRPVLRLGIRSRLSCSRKFISAKCRNDSMNEIIDDQSPIGECANQPSDTMKIGVFQRNPVFLNPVSIAVGA